MSDFGFLDHKRQGMSELDNGSPENHCPFVPKYSRKEERMLQNVDLTSISSVNAIFFPEQHAEGKDSWISVPKHILGFDTDFAFVVKKVEDFGQWSYSDQMRELKRWDNMQRWERNMFEDRIAILMQQKKLMHQKQRLSSPKQLLASPKQPTATGSSILRSRVTGHKRNREFQFATMTPSKSGTIGDKSLPAGVTSPKTEVVVDYSEIPESKRRCNRMKPPIPSRYQGDIEADKDLVVPDFVSLMNFPSLSLPGNLRSCVMCGTGCPTAAAVKYKKARTGSKSNSDEAFIPTQNKGLCTLCDVHVWIIGSSGMEIKWCKGCKNFRCWASFGEKGHATKCLRCRERQREKYAAQKAQKEENEQRFRELAY